MERGEQAHYLKQGGLCWVQLGVALNLCVHIKQI